MCVCVWMLECLCVWLVVWLFGWLVVLFGHWLLAWLVRWLVGWLDQISLESIPTLSPSSTQLVSASQYHPTQCLTQKVLWCLSLCRQNLSDQQCATLCASLSGTIINFPDFLECFKIQVWECANFNPAANVFVHTWYLSFFLHGYNFWLNFSPRKSA